MLFFETLAASALISTVFFAITLVFSSSIKIVNQCYAACGPKSMKSPFPTSTSAVSQCLLDLAIYLFPYQSVMLRRRL